jgi:LPS export ABC transporter protein LptC
MIRNNDVCKAARQWLFAVLSAVVTLGAVFGVVLTGCEKESSAGTLRLDTLNLATHRSYNPVVEFLDSGRMRAVLYAAWANVYDTKQETHLGGGLRVEFMSRSGVRVSVLTADSAFIDDRTKDMTARGNVVVVSEYPVRTVRTTVMMWDNARQRLHSKEFVSISSPEEILQGYGFESDQNLEHYTIYQVSGQTTLMPLDAQMASTATIQSAVQNPSGATPITQPASITAATVQSPTMNIRR